MTICDYFPCLSRSACFTFYKVLPSLLPDSLRLLLLLPPEFFTVFPESPSRSNLVLPAPDFLYAFSSNTPLSFSYSFFVSRFCPYVASAVRHRISTCRDWTTRRLFLPIESSPLPSLCFSNSVLIELLPQLQIASHPSKQDSPFFIFILLNC